MAAVDVDGDGCADIVTGAGPGGGPHVRVFSGIDLSDLASFYAFDPVFNGGVTSPGLTSTATVSRSSIIGAGPGGGPMVRVFRTSDLAELASFDALDPTFTGGVFIGSVGGGAGLRFTSASATSFTADPPARSPSPPRVAPAP